MRFSRSLRSRSVTSFETLAWAYSAIEAPTSHVSPPRMSANAWPELDVPRAQRLHLGAGQHDARLDALEELVVVPRAAVLGDQLVIPVFLGHLRIVGPVAGRPLP